MMRANLQDSQAIFLLVLQLAKAEAEAAALRKELEARKSVAGSGDLGKPRAGNKRIDGTGLREVLWEGPGAQKERAKFTKCECVVSLRGKGGALNRRCFTGPSATCWVLHEGFRYEASGDNVVMLRVLLLESKIQPS